MIRNQSGQIAGGQVINATTGGPFVGTVTVYVTGDAGIQAIGTVGSGLCTDEGNGYYTYRPSQAETDYATVAFTFTGSGAISATTQYDTLTEAQQAALTNASTSTALSGLDVVQQAFAILNVYMHGASIPSADSNLAFRMLNQMIGSFAQQNGTIPVVAREVFDMEADKGGPSDPYTIGDGGDIDTDRPPNQSNVCGAGLLLGNSSPEVEIPRAVCTDDAYQAIQVKELSNALFTLVYYKPTYASGLGTINLWPVPDTDENQLVLYLQKPISQFASLASSYTFPPGYDEMIVYNLARRMATPWGRTLPDEARQIAFSSLSLIKRANVKMTDLFQEWYGDPRAGYNINTGTGG